MDTNWSGVKVCRPPPCRCPLWDLAAQERGRSKLAFAKPNTPSRLNAKHNAFLMECDIGLYIRLPTPLELSLEVDASQDNAWRSAFELQCYVFASRTVFNPIAESHEIGPHARSAWTAPVLPDHPWRRSRLRMGFLFDRRPSKTA